jgi:hypothetical protein
LTGRLSNLAWVQITLVTGEITERRAGAVVSAGTR